MDKKEKEAQERPEGLKPCPFCGSTKIGVDVLGGHSDAVFFASCDGCGAGLRPKDTFKKAEAAWNTRAGDGETVTV